MAAQSRCVSALPVPLIALMVSVIEKYPAAMLPTVNSDGSRNMPRRSRAFTLALASAGSRPFTVPLRSSWPPARSIRP